MSSKKKFEVINLCHIFHSADKKGIQVLDDLSFYVNENEFLAVVGPSGCGKTTLLNILSGLLKPSGGTVLFEGNEHNQVSKKIGYISQSNSLMPWRTALRNVEIGMELRGVQPKKRREIALRLINEAGLSGFEKAYPHELSGGMQKRIDIIKILALDPEIIFMDEPFGSLDVLTRETLQNYILSMWNRTKKTIIFITHDLGEAITLSDRVLILSKRPARIKTEYKVRLPRPRSSYEIRYTPEFIHLHKQLWNDLRQEIE